MPRAIPSRLLLGHFARGTEWGRDVDEAMCEKRKWNAAVRGCWTATSRLCILQCLHQAGRTCHRECLPTMNTESALAVTARTSQQILGKALIATQSGTRKPLAKDGSMHAGWNLDLSRCPVFSPYARRSATALPVAYGRQSRRSQSLTVPSTRPSRLAPGSCRCIHPPRKIWTWCNTHLSQHQHAKAAAHRWINTNNTSNTWSIVYRY